MNDKQRYLLLPTAAETLVGSILDDSVGQNARKKIAKRRIGMMISGNIASYSWSLNNPDALADITETNELASCLAQISAARDLNKDAAKEKKAAEERERDQKKANNLLAFENKKAELHDELVAEVNKGIDHLHSLKKNKLLLL